MSYVINEKIHKVPIFKEIRLSLLLILSAIFIQFIVFKYLYPFPNFIPESTSYIEAAANNQSLNSWPIGYSKFLRIFHVLTQSHTALVLFQYLFLQISLLIFLFTLSYQLNLNKPVNRILFTINLFNPILLHLSNFISSDALFVGLSLCWFSSLLWILVKADLFILLLHALVLFLAFTLRYYALYYPIISISVVLFSEFKWKFKLQGVLIVVIPLLLYIAHTVNEYKRTTNTTQFSSFGGWQLAANALYAYSHIPLDSVDRVPFKFKALHKIVNQHMNWLNQYKVRPDSRIGIYYQWNEGAPLKVYMRYYWKNDSSTNNFKRYAVMGDLYAGYGSWQIRNHPVSYLKYFVLPNLVDYYAPPTEFLGYYNMGFDSVSSITIKWFKLKNNKVYNYYNSKQVQIAKYYTILLPVINVIFLAGLFAVLSLKELQTENLLRKRILQITLLVWLSTVLFSAFTAYTILRYEIFSMILTLSFSIICISILIQNLSGIGENSNDRNDPVASQ